MSPSTVIKWAHRILTLVLLLLVLGYFAYQRAMGPPNDDALLSAKQIGPDTWLYITENQGGATVSDVYRYYLSAELKTDPLKALGHIAPFLTADTADAKVNKWGNRVSINLSGKVYQFTSSVFYTSDGIAMTPSIDFTSRTP